jgi:hypothetical protein
VKNPAKKPRGNIRGNKLQNSKIVVPALQKSWGVSVIRSRAHFLGFVEAPDAKAAEVAAVKQFELDDWQRKRLLVRERI